MACSLSTSIEVGVVLVLPPFQVDRFEKAADLGDGV